MIEVKTTHEIYSRAHTDKSEDNKKWVSLHDLKNLIKKYRVYSPTVFDDFQEEVFKEE